MADQDLTSLDELKPDGQVDQVLTLDDAERETRLKLKAWADVEHGIDSGGHTIVVGGTAPAVPTNWQMWFNTGTNELLIYHDDYDKWATVEQPTFNYLYNASFSRFEDANTIPRGWWYYGTSTSGTITPSGAGLPDLKQKFGPYALAINSGNGTKFAYQYLGRGNSTFAPFDYWKGRTMAFGCWVWANAANKVRIISADDGGGSGDSGYHPGDSTWRWMVASSKVHAASTAYAATLAVEGPGVSANFSGPTLVEGSWCPHALPSSIVVHSELLTMGSPQGTPDTVPGDSVHYGPHGRSPGTGDWWHACTPMPYECLISNMRVYIPNGPGTGKSYAARLIRDGGDTPLTCTIADLNTFNFNNTDKVYAGPGALLSTRVFGTAGANLSPVRITYLVEEVPRSIT